MPVCLRDTVRRQGIRHLLERTPQAHQIAVAPQPGLHQPAAVEIDQEHVALGGEQDVVRVEVRMAHAQVVEGADAAPDGDPAEDRQRTRAQALGQ